MFFGGVVLALLFGAMILPAVESPRWLMKMRGADQNQRGEIFRARWNCE